MPTWVHMSYKLSQVFASSSQIDWAMARDDCCRTVRKGDNISTGPGGAQFYCEVRKDLWKKDAQTRR